MATFLVTFREALEAAIIVGILFAFLNKNKASEYRKFVWTGVFIGTLLSLFVGFLFRAFSETLSERSAEIFEGIVALFGALLITSLILWIHKHKDFSSKIENDLSKNFSAKNFSFILIFTTFINILREGFETVIFLSAIPENNSLFDFFLGILGIVFAILVGYLFYKGSLKIKLSTFFKITNVLLILFAAGLIAYGIHELQEAHILPIIVEHVYDINHIINEKGTFGSILKGLFGYNGNPSLIELIAYWSYLIPAMYFTLRTKS